MTWSQELKPALQVELGFVYALPEAKRVPILSLLTHTGFEDLSTFGQQVGFPRHGLRHFTTNFLS
jgi:hypothetical protein